MNRASRNFNSEPNILQKASEFSYQENIAQQDHAKDAVFGPYEQKQQSLEE